MLNLSEKQALRKLASKYPALSQPVAEVLRGLEMDRQASEDELLHKTSYDKESSATMVRIVRRSSLGDVFTAYLQHLAGHLIKSTPELSEMSFELRGAHDLGFRFTQYDPAGEMIVFFADISFAFAPEYLNVIIKGARGANNFSDRIRILITDPLHKTASRISSYLSRQ